LPIAQNAAEKELSGTFFRDANQNNNRCPQRGVPREFTIRFFGDSRSGPEIWVAVGPSKMEWRVLIKRDTREWPLLAALAFIHVEAWNYG